MAAGLSLLTGSTQANKLEEANLAVQGLVETCSQSIHLCAINFAEENPVVDCETGTIAGRYPMTIENQEVTLGLGKEDLYVMPHTFSQQRVTSISYDQLSPMNQARLELLKEQVNLEMKTAISNACEKTPVIEPQDLDPEAYKHQINHVLSSTLQKCIEEGDACLRVGQTTTINQCGTSPEVYMNYISLYQDRLTIAPCEGEHLCLKTFESETGVSYAAEHKIHIDHISPENKLEMRHMYERAYKKRLEKVQKEPCTEAEIEVEEEESHHFNQA